MTKSSTPAAVIILAAGQGKRMHSPLPKVLHPISGDPLLFHVIRRVAEITPQSPICIVIGHQRDQIEAEIRANRDFSNLDISFVHQPEQRGTGHAARFAMDSSWGLERVREKSAVLVLPGDLPLIPGSLIEMMIATLGRGVALRLLTCEFCDPTGYGRVIRRGKVGPVLRIVEERDATSREKAIREVASSIYLFESTFLKYALGRISDKNAQREYYLTDCIAQAARAKKNVDAVVWQNPEDLRGVNDPWELAQAERIMNERLLRRWAREGVRLIDPASIWIDSAVVLAKGVTIYPGSILKGKSKVASGATLGPHVFLNNVEVAENADIKAGTCAENSRIGAGAKVGPYAHLRPESIVGPDAKIGNFVELKKSTIGARTSIAHLSYVGDADVGSHVNIGCGFITCNFDGRIHDGQRKHRTVIEDHVFLGSDCQAVAPVRIGKGAYVASGSTLTEDVEPGALAIARARQVNKPGYARKLRDAEAEQEK